MPAFLLFHQKAIWRAVYKVREGELGNEFFIVIDGTADVTQNCAGNIKKVGQLGPRYADLDAQLSYFHFQRLFWRTGVDPR